MRTRSGWKEGLAVAICLIHVIPFYILFTTSFKMINDFSSKWQAPGYLYLDNFINVWKEAHLGNALFNNVLITGGAGVLIVLVGSIAAYPLARRRTLPNRVVYAVFVS
ncbi:MAG: carbohydrate ABC transporter permease, partial [Cohnella sp.]|nr:carbohydrate ABC transporter permease [Cohnella sp.]